MHYKQRRFGKPTSSTLLSLMFAIFPRFPKQYHILFSSRLHGDCLNQASWPSSSLCHQRPLFLISLRSRFFFLLFMLLSLSNQPFSTTEAFPAHIQILSSDSATSTTNMSSSYNSNPMSKELSVDSAFKSTLTPLYQTLSEMHQHSNKDDQFALPDVIEEVKQANWTVWVDRIRDPANRSYVVAVAMCFDLVVVFAGYQFLRLWLFMGGFFAVAGTFFIFSPNVFDLAICCGAGTENARALVSVVLGLLAGLAALWILRAGIFLTGCCLGLAVSLLIKSALGRLNVIALSADGIALLYVGVGLACGCLALWQEKVIVILATASVGAFFFCVGLGYYQHCHFTDVLEIVHEHIRRHDERFRVHRTHNHLGPCDDILLIIWLVLSVLGALFQFGYCNGKSTSNESMISKSQQYKGSGISGRYPENIVVVRKKAGLSSSSESSRRNRDRKSKRLSKLHNRDNNHFQMRRVRKGVSNTSNHASYGRTNKLSRLTKHREQRLLRKHGLHALYSSTSCEELDDTTYTTTSN
eukprot:gene4313-6621_t